MRIDKHHYILYFNKKTKRLEEEGDSRGQLMYGIVWKTEGPLLTKLIWKKCDGEEFYILNKGNKA